MARSLIESFATTGDRNALVQAEGALKAVRKFAVTSNDRGHLQLAPPRELVLGNEIIHSAYRNNLGFCVVEPFVRYYEVTADRAMLDVAKGLADRRLAGFGQYETNHIALGDARCGSDRASWRGHRREKVSRLGRTAACSPCA
jgi:hypothetical protein